MSQVENMNEPITPAEPLSISDTQPAILIEEPQTFIQEEKQDSLTYCTAGNAGNGWCKNVCKVGQTICDECTKMMDSYP